MIQLTSEEYEKLSLAQRRLDALRAICGSVEDGSATTVRIFQDDASREWFVRFGNIRSLLRQFHASSFEGAIDAALAYHYNNMDR